MFSCSGSGDEEMEIYDNDEEGDGDSDGGIEVEDDDDDDDDEIEESIPPVNGDGSSSGTVLSTADTSRPVMPTITLTTLLNYFPSRQGSSPQAGTSQRGMHIKLARVVGISYQKNLPINSIIYLKLCHLLNSLHVYHPRSPL